MGEVVGAGLIAHVPTIVLPEEIRRELNNGEDTTLVAGLHQLRKEVFESLDYDTVVVLDSHWATTVEFVVTAQERRTGLFTSEELPRGMSQRPYDFLGDPELAQLIASKADDHGTWITAISDDHLPIFYATTNLWEFLGQGMPDKRWISIGVCQTADTEDNLRLGRALGDAIEESDRKVVLLASGALSHTFWPLRELRKHEAAGAEHIFTPEAAAADAERMEWFETGDHAQVLDTMPAFYRFRPEARFGHYLMMIGAIGEGDCTATGRRYGEYENSIGTGQVHYWFERPEGRLPQATPYTRRPRGPATGGRPGFASSRLGQPSHQGAPMPLRETRRILLDGNIVDVERHGDELVAGDGRTLGIAEAVHLAPVVPSKIVCVHLNYSSRVQELMLTLPPAPTYFHKPVSSLNAHESAVVRPLGCKWLNYEGEIAIVIGRTARNISPDEAGDYIHGYSIANDYGLHDFRDTDSGSMLRVKGSDTLCPVGPGMVEGWDFHGKQIRTLVNGNVRQDANTDEMMWDPHYLVADIARTITLQPGDLLLSGTPAISRTVYPGDVVEVEVEGLGTLRNHIVEGPTPIRTDVGAQPTESEEVLSTAKGGDWEFRGIRKPDLSGKR